MRHLRPRVWLGRAVSTFDLERIVAKARAKEGLEDFGPGDFEEPLGVLLEAYASAGLNDIGRG